MEYCEICGAPIKGKPYVVFIEGAKLRVCEKCAKKADSIIEKPFVASATLYANASAAKPGFQSSPQRRPQGRIPLNARPARPSMPFKASAGDDVILQPNYGELVRRAREKKGLTAEQLAKKLNEKESVIRRVEEEKLRPPEALVDKLEKELEVKIRASPPPAPASPKVDNAGPQLKDVAKLRDTNRRYHYPSIL